MICPQSVLSVVSRRAYPVRSPCIARGFGPLTRRARPSTALLSLSPIMWNTSCQMDLSGRTQSMRYRKDLLVKVRPSSTPSAGAPSYGSSTRPALKISRRSCPHKIESEVDSSSWHLLECLEAQQPTLSPRRTSSVALRYRGYTEVIRVLTVSGEVSSSFCELSGI